MWFDIIPIPANVIVPLLPATVLSIWVVIFKTLLICKVEFLPAKSILLNVWLPTPVIIDVTLLLINLRGPKLGVRPTVALRAPIDTFWLTSTSPKAGSAINVFIQAYATEIRNCCACSIRASE